MTTDVDEANHVNKSLITLLVSGLFEKIPFLLSNIYVKVELGNWDYKRLKKHFSQSVTFFHMNRMV